MSELESRIVIGSGIAIFPGEPKAAILTLHTMEGSDQFAITAEVAEHLIDLMQKFLQEPS